MPFFHHDSRSNSNPNSTNTNTNSVPSNSSLHSRHDADAAPESRRSGLFGSRHHNSKSQSPAGASTAPSTAQSTTSSMKHSHSILHRNSNSYEDPSISAAREQVVLAEDAEKEADRALIAARQAVKDAKGHVKMLEREAAEGARLAKIKQDQAARISKRAQPLGRFGN